MIKNSEFCFQILKPLLELGITEFVVCAGARNSPFVFLLEELMTKNSNLKVYSFFEERSAAFWALGRAQKLARPVPIITTSGTAAVELLPALVEAYYQASPMIVITADRPKSYRGTGAPQAIEQVGIFSHYAHPTWDLDIREFQSWTDLTQSQVELKISSGSIHLNVCLDEPLKSPSDQDLKFNILNAKENQIAPITDGLKTQRGFLHSCPVLAIVGTLLPKDQNAVLDFLKKSNCIVYCEATSGLRGHPELIEKEILGGEDQVSYIVQTNKELNILRLGGVPTLRLWRDLESSLKSIEVISFSHTQFSGLARGSKIFSIEMLGSLDLKGGVPISDFAALNRKADENLKSLIKKYPLSELAWVHWYSQKVKRDPIYLGNSLPIRNWDWVADRQNKSTHVLANRGANGIDGQLSTFLGWSSHFESRSWALVGDLTAMYDLAALWAHKYSHQRAACIGIINNQGGQIFDRMFSNSLFINSHSLDFSGWAKMWGWSYKVIENIEDKGWEVPEGAAYVIELKPCGDQTRLFNLEWKSIWNK